MADEVELATFTSTGESYVYAPLPAATSYGHRAELWNPDKWLQEVSVKLVTAGDACRVRLMVKGSGELFAECPLPSDDGTPLTTAVEPVVDSSRYFVLRVEDRETRKHAFVGLGFRERADASNFTAALDDYRQFLRRKREAEALRRQFAPASGEPAAAAGEAGEPAAAQAGPDLSLKPGQTITIKLSASLKRAESGGASSSSSSSSSSRISRVCQSGSGKDPQGLPASGVLVPPPPPASQQGSSSAFFRLQPPPPPLPPSSQPVASGALTAAAAAGAASMAALSLPPDATDSAQVGEQQHLRPPSQPSTPQGRQACTSCVPPAAAASAVAAAPPAAGDEQEEEDEWGDFVTVA